MKMRLLWLLLTTMFMVFDGGGSSRSSSMWPRGRRHHHADYGFLNAYGREGEQGVRHAEYGGKPGEPPRPDGLPPVHHAANYPDCPLACRLHISHLSAVRASFQDRSEDQHLVTFSVTFPAYNNVSLLGTSSLMGRVWNGDQWYWTGGRAGRALLQMPLDADVLSLYLLDPSQASINLRIVTEPRHCLLAASPECRLYAVRSAIIHNVTHDSADSRRDFLCHRVIGKENTLIYRCCDTKEFVHGEVTCYSYTSSHTDASLVLHLISIISGLVTLFSPIFLLRLKLAFKFDAVTKFFRASLKHGITGQRNYVIRISSRQLINLSDPRPFSLPRFTFRLLVHAYGEGRCCIHWWADWRHQPKVCKKENCCQRCWFMFCRAMLVIVLCPVIIYVGIILYIPRIQTYMDLITHMQTISPSSTPELNINLLGLSLLPFYSPALAVWGLFAFVSLIYTALLLTWPNNTLEKCLLRYEGKKVHEGPQLLYDKMTLSYRAVLQRLAYGDYQPKQHFFRIRWMPWGLQRTAYFIGRAFMQIPVINLAVAMLMYDSALFGLRDEEEETASQRVVDETEPADPCECPVPGTVCKWSAVIFIWLGFLFLLSGYCTAVYLMIQFVLNVCFFTLLGVLLHSSTILPWVCCAAVIVYYFDDTLTLINEEHREILRLIDENSPRISAVEDTEDVFRSEAGQIHILKTHNLGAVKFIDGDNTEYVSKELYYNVCADLKCGWGRTLRRLTRRTVGAALWTVLVFGVVVGGVSPLLAGGVVTGLVVTVVAVGVSLLPYLVTQRSSRIRRHRQQIRTLWARIMPDVLDRHIRVDRTVDAPDSAEEELTTYDVRPVGALEMEVPRETAGTGGARTLRLWKFPWVVSVDQQTHSNESFIVALANKLAAAGFISKVVTRAYSSELADLTVLRQWCLLVENAILEGAATASSINGIPVDSVRLFPRDVQPLVSPFSPGNTIDSVVDSINRELYGPFTKGVLVTIGNTSFALGKLDSMIFAFNGSCHGDQVTDLFGAVLIMAEFNTQNLQTTIKYIIDPYNPDGVPVYTVVPTEGFIFRSPEILELDTNMV